MRRLPNLTELMNAVSYKEPCDSFRPGCEALTSYKEPDFLDIQTPVLDALS